MGVLARWRAARRAAYGKQIVAAAAAEDAAEAARARDRLLVTAHLQRVHPGTALYLRADEWRGCPELRPGSYVDVRVSLIHDQIVMHDGMPWVGVTGHALECAWLDDDGHVPCMVLLARVDAVLRAAS